jgi:Amidohydrolase
VVSLLLMPGRRSFLGRKVIHLISRRNLVAGLGAMLTSGAAAQPFGPGQPPDGRTREPGPGNLPALQGGPRVPHIDVHMHLVGGQQRMFSEAVEACAAQMQEFGIAKGVVMSPPQPPPGAFDASDFVPELRRYGDRFAFLGGGGSLNPMLHAHHDPESVTPEVRQEFAAAANRWLDEGASGFGEIAVLHLSLVDRHPFEEVSGVHPLLSTLAEIAARRNAVIDLHMDPVTAQDSMRTPSALKVPPNPPTLAGNISNFGRLLADNPGARIVWAHGGSDFTGNLAPALVGQLMDAHPNLFMSLRPIPPQAATANPFGLRFYNLILTPSGIDPQWLALLRKHPDRFVIGSDTFFISSAATTQGPAATLSRGNQGRLAASAALLSRLPPDLAAKIALANPSRIYRI